jgi:hypothetical protein
MSGREPAMHQISAPNSYAIASPPHRFRVYVLWTFRLLSTAAVAICLRECSECRPTPRPSELATAFLAFGRLAVLTWKRLRREGRRRDTILSSHEVPPLGAHLVSSRRLYRHHGIYVGGGRVIHYSGFAYRLKCRGGPVQEVSLAEFTQGRATRVRRSAAMYSSQEVVRRARARLGEDQYRLLTNNCWHFCKWCLYGAAGNGLAIERRQFA